MDSEREVDMKNFNKILVTDKTGNGGDWLQHSSRKEVIESSLRRKERGVAIL